MHISIEVKRPNVYDLHEDKIKERIKTNPNLCPNSLKQLQSQNYSPNHSDMICIQ